MYFNFALAISMILSSVYFTSYTALRMSNLLVHVCHWETGGDRIEWKTGSYGTTFIDLLFTYPKKIELAIMEFFPSNHESSMGCYIRDETYELILLVVNASLIIATIAIVRLTLFTGSSNLSGK